MIKLTVHFFKQANKFDTKKITTDSNEPVLNTFQHAAGNIFSAADLWNIQRKGKTIMQRRWSF